MQPKITIEMLKQKPSLAFAVLANKEFAHSQRVINKALEILPEDRRKKERRKARRLIAAQILGQIIPRQF